MVALVGKRNLLAWSRLVGWFSTTCRQNISSPTNTVPLARLALAHVLVVGATVFNILEAKRTNPLTPMFVLREVIRKPCANAAQVFHLC